MNEPIERKSQGEQKVQEQDGKTRRASVTRDKKGGGVVYSVVELFKDPNVIASYEKADGWVQSSKDRSESGGKK